MAGSNRSTRKEGMAGLVRERWRELALLGVFFSSAFALVSLAGWHPDDPTWVRPSVVPATVHNPCGPLGANVADLLFRAFGVGAWAVLGGLVAPVWWLAGRRLLSVGQSLLAGWLYVVTLGLVDLAWAARAEGSYPPGGRIGAFLAAALVDVVGTVGAWMVSVAALVSAGSLLLGVSWSEVAARAVALADRHLPAVQAQLEAVRTAAGRGLASATTAVFQAVGQGLLWLGRTLWAGLRWMGLALIAGLRRLGLAILAGLRAAGLGTVDALRRGWHAAFSGHAGFDDTDPDWTHVTGLDPLELSDADVASLVDGVETATWVSSQVPHTEAAWAPTAPGGPDEVLELFPPLGRRRRLDGVSTLPEVASGGAAALAGRAPVSISQPGAGLPSDGADDGPLRPSPPPAPVPEAPEPWAGSTSRPAAAPPPAAVAELTPEAVEAPEPTGFVSPVAAQPPAPAAASAAPPAPSAAPPAPSAAPPAPTPAAPAAPRATPAPAASAPPERAYPPRTPDPSRVPEIPERVAQAAHSVLVEKAEGLEARVDDDGGAVGERTLYFELPPLAMLDKVPEQRATIDESELQDLAQTVEDSLASFKVTGEVTNVRVGPVVTIFEFLPDAGVSVRKINRLADDLAMALCALSVRVVAPIPGKGVVGIEIPSKHRLTIFLREVLASPTFRKSNAALPVILGKSVDNEPMIADLAKMPHLLVGGTTGSGKSVGVNGMLMSLLFTKSPDDLRLLLIDPKKLEFEAYSDVPHLLHPVVTEPSGAAAALAWACREMDRRYELLARWRTRNIKNYNKKVARESRNWTREKARKFAPKSWPDDVAPPKPETLPYIVIVIDELADLMMTAKKEVQDSIVRLAQMARACGMHLIIATQRPSVDVVTGLIKSNLPTRIAFKLRSVVDSRTILDTGGAEKLLGMGDMLYLPGAGEVQRCHGAFVSDDEVGRVIDFLKDQREPDYIEGVTADGEGGLDPDAGLGSDVDELFDDAVNLVLEKGKASTSMIQRHLKIGYNRAARIVDEMEARGMISPADGARPREVLVGDHAG